MSPKLVRVNVCPLAFSGRGRFWLRSQLLWWPSQCKLPSMIAAICSIASTGCSETNRFLKTGILWEGSEGMNPMCFRGTKGWTWVMIHLTENKNSQIGSLTLLKTKHTLFDLIIFAVWRAHMSKFDLFKELLLCSRNYSFEPTHITLLFTQFHDSWLVFWPSCEDILESKSDWSLLSAWPVSLHIDNAHVESARRF